MGQLGVLDQIWENLHGARFHSGALKSFHQGMGFKVTRPVGHSGIEFLNIRDPALMTVKAGLPGPSRTPHLSAQALPISIGPHGDRDPAVLSRARVDAMGCRLFISVSSTLHDFAVCAVTQNHFRQAVDRRFDL